MRAAPILLAALVAAFGEPAKIDLYLVGDSTMADKPTPDTNPERGWGQLLPRYFDDRVVVHNHAVNGRSTKSFIDEGKWKAVQSRLKRGDYVFIEFGHNDEKSEDTTRYAAPHGAYRANLERFVAETRAHGATPVLFTPIVRRKWSAAGALEETHGEYPGVVAEVARTRKVAFVDLGALTRDLVRDAGPEGSKRLYVWVKPGESSMYPEGRQDDTHLSVPGGMEVARLAAAAVRKADLPGLSEHVVAIDPQPAAAPDPIRLWEKGTPNAVGDAIDDQPTITPFLLPGQARAKSAVLVFPGGGYEHLALEKEGMAVARWLNELGVAAFVVRYRLGPRYHHPAMLDDAAQAMRVVRANADRWHLDPEHVGVIGFSAGGHLASTLATHADDATRPAFMILVYPVVTMDGPAVHAGSRRNLLGDRPSGAAVKLLSNETQITHSTPPAFIVATADDSTVPIANSARLYQALRAAGVPAELHVFEHGKHGFGLAATDAALAEWTVLCEQWLARHGWATARETGLTKRP